MCARCWHHRSRSSGDLVGSHGTTATSRSRRTCRGNTRGTASQLPAFVSSITRTARPPSHHMTHMLSMKDMGVTLLSLVVTMDLRVEEYADQTEPMVELPRRPCVVRAACPSRAPTRYICMNCLLLHLEGGTHQWPPACCLEDQTTIRPHITRRHKQTSRHWSLPQFRCPRIARAIAIIPRRGCLDRLTHAEVGDHRMASVWVEQDIATRQVKVDNALRVEKM